MATFDSKAYELVWRERAAFVGPLLAQASRRLAIDAVALSKKQMTEEIYDKPVDTRANGNPKWKRTGDLRRAERQEVRDSTTVLLVNNQVYAHRRHEANKPDYPYRVAPERTAHWRDDIAPDLKQRQNELYRESVIAMLRRL